MTYKHDTNQINQPDALALARELEIKVKALVCPFGRHTAALRPQYARIAELEAMLDAVGAGGVGQSIKTQMQADTDPAAWAIYSDDGTAIRLWSRDKATAQEAADKFGLPLVALYTAPKPTENLRCKSTQKRLATLWGYEKARQPLTDEQIMDIWYRVAGTRFGYVPFARAIESAHGITGGQQ